MIWDERRYKVRPIRWKGRDWLRHKHRNPPLPRGTTTSGKMRYGAPPVPSRTMEDGNSLSGPTPFILIIKLKIVITDWEHVVQY